MPPPFTNPKTAIPAAVDTMPVSERRALGKAVFDQWRNNNARAAWQVVSDHFGAAADPEAILAAQKENGDRPAVSVLLDAYLESPGGIVAARLSWDERKLVLDRLTRLSITYFNGYCPSFVFLTTLYHQIFNEPTFNIVDQAQNATDHQIDFRPLGYHNVSNARAKQWLQAHVAWTMGDVDFSVQHSRWYRKSNEPFAINDIVPGGVVPADWLRPHEDLDAAEMKKLEAFADQMRQDGIPYDLIASQVMVEHGIAQAHGCYSVRWLNLYRKPQLHRDSPFAAFYRRMEVTEQLSSKLNGEPDAPGVHPAAVRDLRIRASMASMDESFEQFFARHGISQEDRELLCVLGRTLGCSVQDCRFGLSKMQKSGLEPGVWLPDTTGVSGSSSALLCPVHWYATSFLQQALKQDVFMSRAVLCQPEALRVLMSIGVPSL